MCEQYPDINSINLHLGLCLTDDGDLIEVDSMLDFEGIETNDPEQAEFLIAHYPKIKRWFTIKVDAFEEAAIH